MRGGQFFLSDSFLITFSHKALLPAPIKEANENFLDL